MNKKALIQICGSAGRSVPLLFKNPEHRLSCLKPTLREAYHPHMNILSAHNICSIYPNAHNTTYMTETNIMNTDQTGCLIWLLIVCKRPPKCTSWRHVAWIARNSHDAGPTLYLNYNFHIIFTAQRPPVPLPQDQTAQLGIPLRDQTSSRPNSDCMSIISLDLGDPRNITEVRRQNSLNMPTQPKRARIDTESSLRCSTAEMDLGAEVSTGKLIMSIMSL